MMMNSSTNYFKVCKYGDSPERVFFFSYDRSSVVQAYQRALEYASGDVRRLSVYRTILGVPLVQNIPAVGEHSWGWADLHWGHGDSAGAID